MNIDALIEDFEQLDDKSKIDSADLKNYILRFKTVVFLLLVLSVGCGLLARSFSVFIGLLLVSFLFFYLFILAQEHRKEHLSLASTYGLQWRGKLRVRRHGLQGVIFGIGHSMQSLNSYTSTFAHGNFGVFTYRFLNGYGRNQTEHKYVAAYFDLDKELPHILLDSKNNDRLLKSSIPRFLDKEYKVELEGDFSKYFSLYTAYPKPAEALTVLSPDVMRTLIEQAPDVDIEIINQRLWVFLPYKKTFKVYAKALRAGVAVLRSAERNILHYKMDDLASFAAQTLNRSKLHSSKKITITASVAVLILYLLYLFVIGGALFR